MSKQIPLTRGLFATVDDADFERVSQFKWYAHRRGNTFYARRLSTILLHAYLMNTPKGMDTDHIDGDGLNCQRYNLRIATHSQNQMNRGKPRNNTSGYKGVTWDKSSKKFKAGIECNGQPTHLGYFSTAEDAARAYDEAAREHHGEFAQTNFP